MKFALLGCDSDALALVRSIRAAGKHRLQVAYEAETGRDELQAIVPGLLFSDDWELLLHGSEVDAVLVGRRNGESHRDAQLRKLVQEAVPLMAIHPACEAIVGFELEMIRADVGGVLLPYCPGCLHPAVSRLMHLLREEPDRLGVLEQLVFERPMASRTGQEVLDQFSRDACLIRAILGDVRRVSALGSNMATISIHMTAENDILARWSIGSAESSADARIVLLGSNARATLVMPPVESAWTLELPGSVEPERFPDWDAHAAALDAFTKARSGVSRSPSWMDACRAVELAESSHRSLNRGRTIELYREEHTEEGSFKGIMAVGGCALLMVTLLVLLVWATVEGIRLPLQRAEQSTSGDAAVTGADPDSKPQTALWIRMWPVYPFILFLLLQLLWLVARTPSRKPTRPSAEQRGDLR